MARIKIIIIVPAFLLDIFDEKGLNLSFFITLKGSLISYV